MIEAIRNIDKALENPIDKSNNDQFIGLKSIFEKSLAVNKNLPQGHLLTFEDLEAKKPKGFGIEASKFQEIIGKKLNKNLNQWDFLTENDLV